MNASVMAWTWHMSGHADTKHSQARKSASKSVRKQACINCTKIQYIHICTQMENSFHLLAFITLFTPQLLTIATAIILSDLRIANCHTRSAFTAH